MSSESCVHWRWCVVGRAGVAGIPPTETAGQKRRFGNEVVLADRELRLGRGGAGGAAGVFARVCTCVRKSRKHS